MTFVKHKSPFRNENLQSARESREETYVGAFFKRLSLPVENKWIVELVELQQASRGLVGWKTIWVMVALELPRLKTLSN